MSTVNIFEQAARKQLRFSSPKGLLSVEDLFNLPLTSTVGKSNLDSIAIELDATLQTQPKKSFVNDTTVDNNDTQLKFDIVKYIIDVRKEENALALSKQENAAKKQQILELIANKQNEEMSGKTIAELTEMLNKLQ